LSALELLAPARTAEIGIAAVDCGADAVYIAGPSFGARSGAGNSVEDIARLCAHAHKFGARIFATVNTVIYEEEIPAVRQLLEELAAAGVDALIVQDPAVLSLGSGLGMAMHASTQCAVRDVEKARFVESLGYERIVLERQMSLEEVRAVSRAVSAEIEFFVHGALCVCYSGQCYLSEYLTGRSANRGECAQACRSLYDVVDGSGKVLARDRAILSLKDYNLYHRLGDLADAGVVSFKIEGRLKGESYVRNVVRAYSEALDALVASSGGKYCRASHGHVRGGFVPDLNKTFNRGYTELYLDGVRGRWAAEGGGEFIGTVERITRDGLNLELASPSVRLANGDGFTFVTYDGSVAGFRADVCEGSTIRCKRVPGLVPGMRLYRNLSAAFERSVEAARPVREIDVALKVALDDTSITVFAESEDGRRAEASLPGLEPAQNASRALSAVREQLSKRSGIYSFTVTSVEAPAGVPFLAASALNGLRRSLADALDTMPVTHDTPGTEAEGDGRTSSFSGLSRESLSYKANIANSLTRALYASRGATDMEDAYELTHRPGVELMRSRYCVRYELGLCPKLSSSDPQSSSSGLSRGSQPLFLINNGRRLRLRFHCATCEMTVEDC
jgi:putative protease